MNRSVLMKLKPYSNPPNSIFRWSPIHTIFSLAKFRLNSPAYKIGSKCMDRRKSPTTPSEPLSEKPRRSTSYTTMTLPNPPKSTQFSLSLSLSLSLSSINLLCKTCLILSFATTFSQEKTTKTSGFI